MALTAAELVAYLSLDKRGFDQGLSGAQRDMQQADSKFRGWMKDAGKATADTIAASAAGMGGLAATAVGVGAAYNTIQQTSRAALTSIMKGGEAANAQMDKLDAFAKNSPFSKQVFIQAQQQLLGFGMEAEKVIPTLDAIQNSVAAVGGSNEQIAEVANILAVVTGTGKITAETLNQLGYRGINAAEIIGESMGKSGNEIRESITKGTLDADKAVEALTTGMQDRFEGASAGVKETMAGAADRIKAAFRDTGAVLAAPFVDPRGGGMAVTWANEFADVLRAAERQAGPFTDMLVRRLGPAFTGLSITLKDARDAVDAFDMSDLESALDKLTPYTPVIAGLGAAIVTMSTTSIPVVGGLARALGPIPAALGAAAAASPEMREALRELMEAAEPLLPVAADMIGLLSSGLAQGALPAVASGLEMVVGIVGPAVELFSELPEPIQTATLAFGALTLAQRAFPGAASGVQRAAQGIGQGIGGVVDSIRPWRGAFEGATGSMGDFRAAVGLAAGDIGKAAGGGLRGAASGLLGLMGGPWGLALTGATVAISLWAKEQAEAKAQVQELTREIDAQTGALSESGREALMRQIQDADMGDAMETAGVSLGMVTSAIIDQGSAYDNLYDKLVASYEAQGKTREEAEEYANNSRLLTYVNDQRDLYGEAAVAAKDLADGIEEQNDELSESQRSWERFTEALGVVSDDTQSMVDRVKALNDALDELEGGTKSAEEAQRELAATGRTLDEFFTSGAEQSKGFADSLVDAETGVIANSEAGDRLHSMLTDLRDDMQAAAIAASDQAKETGDSAGAYEAAMEAMQPYRDQLQQLADDGHLTQEQVNALTGELLGVPEVTAFLITDDGSMGPLTKQVWELTNQILATPDKTITIDEPESPKIVKGLESLGFKVENLPNGEVKITTPNLEEVEGNIQNLTRPRTMSIQVRADTSQYGAAWDNLLADDKKAANRKPGVNGPWAPKYHGGIDVKGMAAGGVMSVAEMVKPGQIRFAGDRKDVDEAWIPLDGSARSLAILAEAARRMPGAKGMAAGGVTSAKRDLAAAEKNLERISSRGKKTTAEDREREAAQKRVEQARERLRKEEDAAREREQAAKEAAARRERVKGLQADLRTDLRRGTITSQVTGGMSGAYSVVDRLAGLGENEDLSTSQRRTAAKSSRRFESDLRKLHTQAERLDEKLKDAQEKAKELEGIESSVTSSLLRDRGVDMSHYSTYENGQTRTFTGVEGSTKRMRADVGQLKTFADKIEQLQKLGIPGVILQEIAEAGPVEGTELADSFLGATKGERQSYLGAWADYEKQAGRIGKIVTGGFYTGGVDAARGVVSGLESQQASVEKQIAKLAASIESTFKSVLGIRSPSTVMYDQATWVGKGAVNAIYDSIREVEAAAAEMGAAMIPELGDITGPTIRAGRVETAEAPSLSAEAPSLEGEAIGEMTETTVTSMQEMQDAVAAGWAVMSESTLQAQQGMLSDTLTHQAGMREGTAAEQATMLGLTAQNLASMRNATSTELATMLGLTQSQLASMRGTTGVEWQTMAGLTGQNLATMRTLTGSELATMLGATQSNLSTMRGVTGAEWATMQGYTSSHMATMRGITAEGFGIMRDSGVSSMSGLRQGAISQMAQAEPGFKGEVNRLIGVFSAFTSSVNDAYGDVGVELDSPKRLYTGGVLPGYTPGVDVHHFRSPTAGDLYLSGGESIMRPEFTRAVGGEQGVAELNRAARYGDAETLNGLLDHAFASGGVIPRMRGVNAFADSGVWRGLWNIVKAQFPQARLTSAYRGGSRTVSGNSSYHSRGMAVDIAGRYSMDTATMGQVANWLLANYGGSNEIIYSPLNGRQIKNGRPYMYGGAVRGQHWNHVHWANSSVPGGPTGAFGPAGGGGISPDFLTKAGIDFSGDFAKDYKAAAEAHGKKILGKHLPQLPENDVLQPMGKSVMESVIDNLIEQAQEYGEQIASAGVGGAGVDQWAGTVLQALQIMGLPSSLLGITLKRMNQESGGNPSAINLWDVNAKRGYPSQGLMQVIPPTFRAFAHPDHKSNILDPLSNILASMRYALSRYGSLESAYGRAGGYANGTSMATPGWHKVGENGEEWLNFRGGETVRTPAQVSHQSRFTREEARMIADALREGRGDSGFTINGPVTVADPDELFETQQKHARRRQALRAGRYS